MKQAGPLKLIFFFVVLTCAVTIVVIFTWEQVLMSPLYSYIQSLYPEPGSADHAWRVAQRIEHFFISATVDVVVVTLLLRIVDRQQRRLREGEERYRALFEHASDGIGVVRADDHVLVEANKKFGEILGCEPQTLIGKHLCELLRNNGGPEHLESIGDVLSRGGPRRGAHSQEWSAEREVSMMTKYNPVRMKQRRRRERKKKGLR